jgi:adenosine deaminase
MMAANLGVPNLMSTDAEILLSRVAAMPKAEIHVHLEGATDAETVYEMAARNRVTLPAASLAEWQTFFEFRDFHHFIDVYLTSCRAIQTLDDWVLMVERFLQNQARQNIRYSEVFISTSQHLAKFPARDFLQALTEGVASGEAKSGSRMRVIADISRETPDSRHAVLEFALMARESGLVVGLGLGGLEAEFPPELFEDVYAEARRQRLRVVAHAGEVAGPESVWGALRSLGAERLGHGIRCLADPALVAHLAAQKIPIEVCPLSNYRLGAVAADAPHPIRAMVDAGLFCTLNSDDPAMFSSSLTEDYQLLVRQGFSWPEIWQLSRNTLEATFLPEPEKAALRAEWQRFADNLA